MSVQNNYRWKILAVAYVSMISFAMIFQSIPPLLTAIILEFNISNAQAALLMSLFALPSIFVAIPGGIASERFGMKKTGMISLVLMIIGTLIVGTSGTFFQACMGRMVSGIGAYILAVIAPQLVSRWFFDKELEIGMSLFSSAIPMGTILSFNSLSIISQFFGWRTAILLTTIFGFISLLIFVWLFKKPAETVEQPHKSVRSRGITKLGSSIWLVGFSYAGFMAALTSFLTFSPAFFVSKGYEIGSASFVSSIVMMGPLTLSPLVGYFAQKFGREELFIGVSGIGLAALIFFFPMSSFSISFVVLIGITAALTRGPTYSLAAKVVDSADIGLAFGIVTLCLNMGVLVCPYIAGLAKDCTGDFTLSFFLMALFAILQTISIGIFSLSRS